MCRDEAIEPVKSLYLDDDGGVGNCDKDILKVVIFYRTFVLAVNGFVIWFPINFQVPKPNR